MLTSSVAARRSRLLEIGFIASLIAAAFVFRAWGMSKVHFWDEAVYLQNAEVICCGKTNYSELDSRPPLISLLFAAVFRVWHSIYAVDIVTALINAFGPALLYLGGRRIVGRIPAAIAALLLAFAPFFIGVFPPGFDTDNTGNSLLADSPALTLILLGFWLLLRALRRQSDLRFAGVGLVFALAVLMRFACLSTIGVLGLLLFAAERRWRAALASAAGFLAGLMPYLGWSRWRYGGFFETLRRGWEYYQGARQSPLYYAENFGNIFCWITLAGLALWAGKRAWYATKKRPLPVSIADSERVGVPRWIESYLWVWAVLALVFFFALPHQEPRYAMPAAPPLFLLAGSGLSVLLSSRRKAFRAGGTVLVAGALVLTFLPDRARFEMPVVDHNQIEEMDISGFLDANFPHHTILYSNFNYPLFGFYSHLTVRELPERGPRLYDALARLPADGLLIVYKDPAIIPDPRPEWLASNPHFRQLREFRNMVLFQYRANVSGDPHVREK